MHRLGIVRRQMGEVRPGHDRNSLRPFGISPLVIAARPARSSSRRGPFPCLGLGCQPQRKRRRLGIRIRPRSPEGACQVRLAEKGPRRISPQPEIVHSCRALIWVSAAEAADAPKFTAARSNGRRQHFLMFRSLDEVTRSYAIKSAHQTLRPSGGRLLCAGRSSTRRSSMG